MKKCKDCENCVFYDKYLFGDMGFTIDGCRFVKLYDLWGALNDNSPCDYDFECPVFKDLTNNKYEYKNGKLYKL